MFVSPVSSLMFSRQTRWWSCRARLEAPSWRPWCSGSWSDHGRDPGDRCGCSSETSEQREDPDQDKDLVFDYILCKYTDVKLGWIFSVVWIIGNHNQAITILLPDQVSKCLGIDHNCGDDNQDGDKVIPEPGGPHWPWWYLWSWTKEKLNWNWMELFSFMYEVTPLIGRGPRLDTIIKVENDVRGGSKHEIYLMITHKIAWVLISLIFFFNIFKFWINSIVINPQRCHIGHLCCNNLPSFVSNCYMSCHGWW